MPKGPHGRKRLRSGILAISLSWLRNGRKPVSRSKDQWLVRAGVSLVIGSLTVFVLTGGSISASAGETVNPPIQYLTCNVTGDSFVLDDSDFKALANPDARGSGPPLTRQYFISLKLTSGLRGQICDSRGLLRAIRKLGTDHCTTKLLKEFPRFLPQFFSDAEQHILIDCQINAATE